MVTIGARECPCDNVPGVEAAGTAVYPWRVKCGYTLIRGVLGVAYLPDCVPRTTSTTMLASLSRVRAEVLGVIRGGEW